MFKIGDFSKLSRVPVKTLRYYDEIGLLKPSGINHFTRYRYYSAEQLPVLYRILALKELGFSLEQIARLLSGNLSSEQLHKMLQDRRAEIEQQILSAQAQLSQVEARLRQIEHEGRLPPLEVILKSHRPQWVASITGMISSYDQSVTVLGRLFADLRSYLSANSLNSIGPEMAIYPENEPGEDGVRVEAALPIPRPWPGNDQVRVYELPSISELASAVHQGRLAAIGEAYQAILSWIQANNYRQTGPVREIYLRFEGEADQTCFIEIQIPVKKIRKEGTSMEPKIVELEAFRAIGMRYYGENKYGEIGQMWAEFNRRSGEISKLATGPDIAYGICTGGPESAFEYVASLAVSEIDQVPSGMVVKEVPANTYVVFEARGIEDIGPTYNRILNEWMPASEYQPGDGPDFERYPDTFDDDPEEKLYIYFPIKKKAG